MAMIKETQRHRITMLNYFPLSEWAVGGCYRTSHFCDLLSSEYDVTLLSLECRSPHVEAEVNHPHGFRELRFSKISSRLIYDFLGLLNRAFLKTKGCGPVVANFLARFNKRLLRELKISSEGSKVLISEFPYLFSILLQYRRKGQVLIYDAHNVEYEYQKGIMSDRLLDRFFLRFIKAMERKSCERADMILAVSERDQEIMASTYGVLREKIKVIPHGVNTGEIDVPTDDERRTAKAALGLGSAKTFLFIGGNHPPNVEALEFIAFNLAKEFKDAIFLVVGDVYREFSRKFKRSIMDIDNIRPYGLVSDSLKVDILKASDIALNPIFSGSGTNVKMLEYMAAGIPLVTTGFGARGLDVKDKKHVLISEPGDFVSNIKLLFEDSDMYNKLRTSARKLVEERYDWNVISERLLQLLREHTK